MSFLYLKHIFLLWRKRFLDNIFALLYESVSWNTHLNHKAACWWNIYHHCSCEILSLISIIHNDYGSCRLEFHNQCEITTINRRHGRAAEYYPMDITRETSSPKKIDAFVRKRISLTLYYDYEYYSIIVRCENTSPYWEILWKIDKY